MSLCLCPFVKVGTKPHSILLYAPLNRFYCLCCSRLTSVGATQTSILVAELCTNVSGELCKRAEICKCVDKYVNTYMHING